MAKSFVPHLEWVVNFCIFLALIHAMLALMVIAVSVPNFSLVTSPLLWLVILIYTLCYLVRLPRARCLKNSYHQRKKTPLNVSQEAHWLSLYKELGMFVPFEDAIYIQLSISEEGKNTVPDWNLIFPKDRNAIVVGQGLHTLPRLRIVIVTAHSFEQFLFSWAKRIPPYDGAVSYCYAFLDKGLLACSG